MIDGVMMGVESAVFLFQVVISFDVIAIVITSLLRSR